MKRKILTSAILLFTIAGIFLGFTSINDNPKKETSPNSSRNKSTVSTEIMKNKQSSQPTDNSGNENQISVAYYTDNFDLASDTVGLKLRGYLVYYRGTGAQGAGATWFQGNSTVFNAFNGAITSYTAANFQVVTGTNNIDSWLVLPSLNVAAGDNINFRCRSTDGTFPDSVRVMYNVSGGSTPESAGWVELGRFQAAINGVWELKTFVAPSSGATARFAIRYNVVDGGPAGANSDYIGIDALNVDAPAGANDVATTAINAPGNIALPTATIAPKATFQNVGTAGQVNVPVTYNITGPVNYTSNKMIATLGAGGSATVTFDSTFLPTAGTYNITVYCSLASDANRPNDTLRKTITVLQPSYGGGGTGTGGYFFANSTTDASPAPSQPTYCRVDTAGSTTLVSNSVAATTITNGTLDDGYWALGGLFGSKKIKFMGVEYDSAFIGTNGIIGLTTFTPGSGNWNPPAAGLPGGTVRPAIYAGWNDLNWGSITQTVNRLSYKVDGAKNRLVITYDRAPLFGDTSATNFETFQVCIDLVNTGSANSNFTLSYDSSFNALNVPFLIGCQDLTGANYLQYTFIDASANVITPGPIFDGSAGVSVTFGPDATKLNGPCDKILSLKLNFQACPNAGAISVLLRDATSPYAIVDSVVATGGGNAINPVYFENAGNGNAYYVVVRSANSVETWSSSNVTFNGGSASYDFTTALSQAYGSNQLISTVGNPGIPSIYQGDANQDGLVDLTDIILVFNAASAFTTGPATDFNCDGTTDLTDIILAFNNAGQFIQIQRP